MRAAAARSGEAWRRTTDLLQAETLRKDDAADAPAVEGDAGFPGARSGGEAPSPS